MQMNELCVCGQVCMYDKHGFVNSAVTEYVKDLLTDAFVYPI